MGDLNELHNLQENLTPQNKIYYRTQLKITTIFSYPYKKRKWPNHH